MCGEDADARNHDDEKVQYQSFLTLQHAKDFKVDEEFDEDMNGAMVDERNITDCWMCPVFVAFIVGMVFVAVYGVRYGRPHLLATPFDGDGKFP